MTWPAPPLSALVDTIVPARDKPVELDGPIPWIRIEDFDGKYLSESKSAQGVTEDTVRSMPLRVFPRGTVVCSCSCTMGTTAIVTRPLVTNQTFIGLVPHGSALSSDFLFYALQGHRDRLTATASGAIQSYLSRQDFGSLRIPIPPPEAQRAIARYLDRETGRIDAIIAAKRRMAELVEQRWQAVLETAIRNLSRRGQDQPLKYACREVIVGIVITPSAWYTEIGVPALRGVNVSAGDISTEDLVHLTAEGDDLHAKSRLRSGDVVIVRTGQAGAAAVVPPSLEGANCIDLVIVRVNERALDPYYLELVLNSDWMQKHVEEYSVGTIQAHFNVSAAKDIPVPVPSLSEQAELVTHLRSERRRLRQAVARIFEQGELLQERRQALITAAVTGDLEIPEAAA
jgi:type I restriction enzyme S subunit